MKNKKEKKCLTVYRNDWRKKKGREDTSSGFPGNVRKSIGLKEKKGKSEWKEKEREREK